MKKLLSLFVMALFVGQQTVAMDMVQAIQAGNALRVQELLEVENVKPNAVIGGGWTPLFHAIRTMKKGVDTTAIINLLLLAGADPSLKSLATGMSALEFAYTIPGLSPEILDALDSATKKFRLHGFAQENNLEGIKELLEIKGLDVDAYDALKRTPLYFAVSGGNKAIIQALLDAGANPLKPGPGPEKTTPLDLARDLAAKSKIDLPIVGILEAAAKGFEVKPIEPDVPLAKAAMLENAVHAAMDKDYDTLIALFPKIKEDANRPVVVRLTDGSDMQLDLLSAAIYGGGDAIINWLLNQEEIDVNDRNNDAEITPAHFAVYFGNTAALEALLKHKAIQVNNQNIEGETPLLAAVRLDFYDYVTLLLNKGANPNLADKKGMTPLWAAVTQKKRSADNKAVIRALLKSGANPTVGGTMGQTPASIAKAFVASLGSDLVIEIEDAAKKFEDKPKEPVNSGDLMKALANLADRLGAVATGLNK